MWPEVAVVNQQFSSRIGIHKSVPRGRLTTPRSADWVAPCHLNNQRGIAQNECADSVFCGRYSLNNFVAMGQIHDHSPVLLVMAAFSRHASTLDWARQRAERECGPIALQSDRFAHNETTFYEPTMGSGLWKIFFAFERRIDPMQIVDLKHHTNAWEDEYKSLAGHPELRPLNIDPGYLTQAKLVLATTKDRDHRLYLGRGIFGEVTLHYQQGVWQERPWTYPDYRRDDYRQFFNRCRDYLRSLPNM
jgi:hypothetical protein